MTWYTALTTGAGLGLAHFAGLWLTVRHLGGGSGAPFLLGLSRFARLALVGVVFWGLSRGGVGHVLWGLAGLWLARCWLLAHLGRD
jgi:F1F0 ATPase subunit 2